MQNNLCSMVSSLTYGLVRKSESLASKATHKTKFWTKELDRDDTKLMPTNKTIKTGTQIKGKVGEIHSA